MAILGSVVTSGQVHVLKNPTVRYCFTVNHIHCVCTCECMLAMTRTEEGCAMERGAHVTERFG